jgi:hypothetical protein
LRESTDGSHAHASRTRTQILGRAQRDGRRRRRTMFVIMPLAAAFIASAAWGAVTGRLSTWVDWVAGGHATPQHSTAQVPREGGSQVATPTTAALPPEAASSGTIETSPSPSSVPSALASSPKAPTPTSTQSSSSTPSSSSVSSREQSLYAAAHSAHFVEHDPAAALRGWDAYLAAYPNGRFALEARYNRAISLVRLGRRDDARAALAPFAHGDHAGYRQHEARELLDALAAADGGSLAQ